MIIEKIKHNSEKRLAKIAGRSLPNFSILGSVDVAGCSISACVRGKPDAASVGDVADNMVHQGYNRSNKKNQ